tara:strand:+ start:317 stop:565 length:249 start_codon:yes stop_codon:yes gene_type:complete
MKVHKHTRAPKSGRLITCPECQHHSRVWHFNWVALTCIYCRESIGKYDWRLYDEHTELDAPFQERTEKNIETSGIASSKTKG